MFYEVLTILFFTSTLVDILYLFFSFCLLLKKKKKVSHQNKIEEGVSVIIAAKNELNNLQKHLPLILNQEYSLFEVIVVSDLSTDGTIEFLKTCENTDHRLKSIAVDKIPNNYNSKKYALQKGIETAQYSLLLLTDADCYPSSTKWISEITKELTPDKDIVLGVSPFFFNKNSFLNQFQQFENISTAVSYILFALLKFPYMGVGRNILYRKAVFIKNNGFKGVEHIKGGDDDLFLQKVMNSNNTAVSISPESFVFTYPKKSVKAYIKQKMRHYSVGSSYKLRYSLTLMFLDVNKLILYFSSITLMSFCFFSTVSIIFALRMAIFLLFYYLVIREVNLKNSFKPIIVIFDLLYILQRNLLGLLSFIFNPKKW